MTQSRRPAGTPVGGQFAPTHRPEATGIELVDDEARALPDSREDLLVADTDRGEGRITEVLDDPDGDGRDVWTVRFLNGEEVTDFADEFELAVDEDGGPVSKPRTESELTVARRAHTLRSLAKDEAFDAGCTIDDVVDDPGRFLFVERSVLGGAFWTTFDDPANAAAYSTDRESPEYWDPAYLLDLDTGERFSPVLAMQWQPDQPNDKEQP